MKEAISLKGFQLEKDVLDKVPVKFVWYYKFMPLKIKGNLLTIAVSQPLDIKTSDEIRLNVGFDIETVLSSQDEIIEAIRRNYGLAAETVEGLLTQQSETLETQEEKVEEIEKQQEEASVIKLVNQILLEAYSRRATDIHIEPYRRRLSLRYRIDGVLYEMNVPPKMKQFFNSILSRIKIMANLNIVERRLPQDGRAIVKVGEHNLDLRISTVPVPFGESVVIRILPGTMLFSLEKLGMEGENLKMMEDLLKKPHGIIFLTGPTGSGKTTTLYSFLSRLNQPERKIITVEDPIEYEIEGITQIQVKPQINLTFAQVLRNILRHDPNVIMVGEVRDRETAEIAIRLALTGHLVFSTLHTNDAAGGITRLLDIGIEPYLVASSVEGFIAQRLVRIICSNCKQPDTEQPEALKEEIKRELNLEKEIIIYKGTGCEACDSTGFKGRQAIYEILPVTSQIKELILRKASTEEIKKRAVLLGMRVLRQHGWYKVVEGVTTPGEVMKVTSSPEANFRAKINSQLKEYHEVRERRIYSRLSQEIPVCYRLFEPTETKPTPKKRGFVRNISAGGLLIESSEVLAVDSVLEVTLYLSGKIAPVTCLAKVSRVEVLKEANSYRIAVYFLDIASIDRQRLEEKIKKEKVREEPLQESRVYPRLKKEIPIRYRLFSPQETQEVLRKGLTKNISAGGLLFELSSPILGESIIEVTIELPDGEEWIVCLARVVRVETLVEGSRYDIAICFLDIRSRDRKRLENYVIGEF